MSGFKTKKINDESFGPALKRARRRKKISLEQAEMETTVRIKYLKAFEEEQFSQLPTSAYAIGYLQKYCEFLELNSGSIVSSFKHADGLYRHSSNELILPKKINDFKFVFTPRILLVGSITITALVFFSYIWIQFKAFTSSPPLKILTPGEQSVVTTDMINVSGLTDEGAKLTINNEPIKLDESGRFETAVKLADGVNTIEIVSENKIKKQSKKTLRILAKLK